MAEKQDVVSCREKIAKARMKTSYDKVTMEREFEKGTWVLERTSDHGHKLAIYGIGHLRLSDVYRLIPTK